MANLEEELVVGPSGPSQDPWSGSWYATHEAYLRASLEKSRVRYSESLRALKAAFPRVAFVLCRFRGRQVCALQVLRVWMGAGPVAMGVARPGWPIL